ncbi:MFS transporter [Bombiscardovia nodaiensis]|uniref:MFS transporter n=1 Tax=Bombiscardovia nodaiensis TaxID=2932181 RepID=A0ABN6SBQ9_9BIFI|nr:MFS transporter [Bombiscardovia nodaiensis]
MYRYSLTFFLTMFLIGTDTFLISPLLPTLSALYGTPTSISGWLVSAYAIGYVIFAFVSGPISDDRDRKKVMLWGLAAFACSTALCGFASNFQLMLLFRFLAGVSASFVTPQVWATIPVIVEKPQIVRVMGYATAGLSVSQLVGIPIGSYLAVVSWRIPFFVIAAAALALMTAITLILPAMPATRIHGEHLSFIKTYAQILSNKTALSRLFAYFIFQTGSFTATTFISTWFTGSFGLSLSGVGTAMIAIGAGNLLGSLLGSRVVSAFGQGRSFLVELLTLVVLYIMVSFSDTFWLAEVLLTIIYLVNGFIFPLFMTTLQESVSQARSTISSLSNAAMYLGETLAGIAGGLLINHFSGYTGIGYFAAILILLAIALYAQTGVFRTTSQESQKSQK